MPFAGMLKDILMLVPNYQCAKPRIKLPGEGEGCWLQGQSLCSLSVGLLWTGMTVYLRNSM